MDENSNTEPQIEKQSPQIEPQTEEQEALRIEAKHSALVVSDKRDLGFLSEELYRYKEELKQQYKNNQEKNSDAPPLDKEVVYHAQAQDRRPVKRKRKPVVLYVILALVVVLILALLMFVFDVFGLFSRNRVSNRITFSSHQLSPITVGEEYQMRITPATTTGEEAVLLYTAQGLPSGLELVVENQNDIFISGRICITSTTPLVGEHTIRITATIENTSTERTTNFLLTVLQGTHATPDYSYNITHAEYFLQNNTIMISIEIESSILLQAQSQGGAWRNFTLSEETQTISYFVPRGQRHTVLIRYLQTYNMQAGASKEVTLSANIEDFQAYTLDSQSNITAFSPFFIAYYSHAHIQLENNIAGISWQALASGNFLSITLPLGLQRIIGNASQHQLCVNRVIFFQNAAPPNFESVNQIGGRFIVPNSALQAYRGIFSENTSANIFPQSSVDLERGTIIYDMVIGGQQIDRAFVAFFGGSEKAFVPNGVQLILENAFYNKARVTEIVLPTSLRKIEQNAITASKIETIFFSGSLQTFDSISIENSNTGVLHDELVVLFFSYTNQAGAWRMVDGIPVRW